MTKNCICCITNTVGKSEFYCENCWNYLMPKKLAKRGLQWNDIWALISHWHAVHDESDKDYKFVHKVVMLAFQKGDHNSI